jgi:hypothetical protein
MIYASRSQIVRSKYDFIIGIDPGVHTGIAVIDKSNKYIFITSMQILQSIDYVKLLQTRGEVVLIIEDARQRKWFGSNANAKQQGAGSIKRDATIWEELCNATNIDALFCAPAKGRTKIDKKLFHKITNWNKQTNEHGRDASMLIIDYIIN